MNNIREKVRELKNEGFFEHGKFLGKSDIENIVGIPYEDEIDDWYKFKVLEISDELGKYGYFCRTKDCENYQLRILDHKDFKRREKLRNKSEKRLISTALNYQTDIENEKMKTEIQAMKDKAVMRLYAYDNVLNKK